MKHLLRTVVAIVAAMSLMGTAIAQECVPLDPKEQSGEISFAHEGQSMSITLFEESGCTWPVNLNGADGLVLDTTGMEGATGSVTASLGPQVGVNVTLNAYFLDAKCVKIAGSDVGIGSSPADAPEAQTLTIPPTAKFFAVGSTVANATPTLTVTLHSDGKDCVVVKKKKRKRRRL